MIFIKDHKKEKASLIKGLYIAFFAIGLGVLLKIQFDNTLADYLLVVTTVFILPVILIAMDHNEKIAPKSKFTYHIICTIAIGIVLFFTSFKDMTTYCENGASISCTLTTSGIFLIYFIIIAIGVGKSNFDKDKKYLKTENSLVEIDQENTRLKKENESLKEKLNDNKEVIENIKIHKITFKFLKIFEITIYEKSAK